MYPKVSENPAVHNSRSLLKTHVDLLLSSLNRSLDNGLLRLGAVGMQSGMFRVA